MHRGEPVSYTHLDVYKRQPLARLEEYRAAMEKVFGEGVCYTLSIRQAGGTKVEF